MDTNPFHSWATLVDCGDVPVTSYDNAYAIKQIQDGHQELLHREPAYQPKGAKGIGKNGKLHPRIITLGGDHTIVLPLLRSINSAYGPVTVIHFDSHLDTWKPKVFGGAKTKQSQISNYSQKKHTHQLDHGTYFYWASEEGLLANNTNIHCGIRTTLSGPSDC
jgi:agmatinase